MRATSLSDCGSERRSVSVGGEALCRITGVSLHKMTCRLALSRTRDIDLWFPVSITGRLWMALVLLSIGSCIGPDVCYAQGLASDTPAAFQRRFRSLKSENPAKRGRDTVVAECIALLDEFPDLAGREREEVMLRIARLYDLSNPTAGFERERLLAIKWYGAARDMAELGTPAWIDVGITLVQRLREHTDETSNVKRARQVLLSLKTHVDPVSYDGLRVAAEDVCQFLAEGNVDEAEAACKALMQMPVESITAPDGQIPAAMVRANAARELVISVAQNQKQSRVARQQRIEQFAESHQDVKGLGASSATAQKIVEAWKDGETPDAADRLAAPKNAAYRSLLLWVNGSVILLLLGFLLLRKTKSTVQK